VEDFIASLPVIAGTVIIVVLIFWLTNRSKKKKRQAIIDLAEKEGWGFEQIIGRLEWGFRLKGRDWTLESISRSTGVEIDSGSSNIQQSTLWISPRTQASDRLINIGERPASANAPFGGDLIRQAFQFALGDDAAGIAEVSAGTGSLRKRYLMMSRKAEDLEYLLSPRLENLLVNYPGSAPLARLDGKGISLEYKGRAVEKPEEILAVVRLGEAFLDAQPS
jgi:hypothetical protein